MPWLKDKCINQWNRIGSLEIKMFLKMEKLGLSFHGDGSVVKNMYSSSRGHKFGPRHPHQAAHTTFNSSFRKIKHL